MCVHENGRKRIFCGKSDKNTEKSLNEISPTMSGTDYILCSISKSKSSYLSVKRRSFHGCGGEEPERRTPRRCRRWPSGRLHRRRSAENPKSTTLPG